MSLLPDHTTQATALLAKWEQAHHSLPFAQRQVFLELVTELLGYRNPHLDGEDVRYTLMQADRLGLGRSEAAGSDRASALLTEVLSQLPGPPTPAGRLLVSFSSNAENELDMDELTLVLEGLQHWVGPEWEMRFGHRTAPGQQPEVRLLVLLGFDAPGQPPAV